METQRRPVYMEIIKDVQSIWKFFLAAVIMTQATGEV